MGFLTNLSIVANKVPFLRHISGFKAVIFIKISLENSMWVFFVEILIKLTKVLFFDVW